MLLKTRLALLALWVGAMMFFSFFVAPAAFAVLPSTYLAGQVVSRTLGGLEVLGLVIAVLLLALLLASRRAQARGFAFELAVIMLMLVSAAISRFIVSARLHQIRLEFGERLSSLAATDPTRATFDLLHQVSVGLTGFNLLAALALIIFLIRTRPAGQ
ncbi:MAG TPA: DUF4149 domain-containing protein [Blastocatellia bacterium]|nr:DUF4149 domain-containing protein [Blastocatellia bacterium]